MNNSATLTFLQAFSSRPKIFELVPTFHSGIWKYLFILSFGLVLCFWKVDTKVFNHEVSNNQKASPDVKLVLALIIIGGLIVRLNLIFEPITYDEAFTYNEYASQSLSTVFSSYTYPNNQILHTLFAKLSTSILGLSEWSLRLPSLLFSLGSIFMAFRIGRLTNIKLGLLFAFTLSFLPILIDYGALARGYSLVLFLVLILWEQILLWKQRTYISSYDQLVFILISSLSIWTIPIAILPLVILLLQATNLISLKLLFKLGTSIGVLSLLLYAPVILLFGFGETVSYPSMPTASWKMLFNHHISHGLEHIYYVFIMNKEVVLFSLLVGIYVIVKQPKIARSYAEVVVVVVLFIMITRIDPPARVWLIILPFIYYPLLKYFAEQEIQCKVNMIFISIVVVISTTIVLTTQASQISVMRDFRMESELEAVQWLGVNHLKGAVKSSFPNDAGIEFYQSVYDIRDNNSTKYKYVFRLKSENDTLESLVVNESSEYRLFEITDSE